MSAGLFLSHFPESSLSQLLCSISTLQSIHCHWGITSITEGSAVGSGRSMLELAGMVLFSVGAAPVAFSQGPPLQPCAPPAAETLPWKGTTQLVRCTQEDSVEKWVFKKSDIDCDSLGHCYQSCQVFKQGMSWCKSLSPLLTVLALSPSVQAKWYLLSQSN